MNKRVTLGEGLGALVSIAAFIVPMMVAGTVGGETTDRPVATLSQGCGFVSAADFKAGADGKLSLSRDANYRETNFRNALRIPVCNENPGLFIQPTSPWAPDKKYTAIVDGRHVPLAVR